MIVIQLRIFVYGSIIPGQELFGCGGWNDGDGRRRGGRRRGAAVGALEGSVALVGPWFSAWFFAVGFFFVVVVVIWVSVVVVVVVVAAVLSVAAVDCAAVSGVDAAEEAGGAAGLLQAVSESARSAARKPAAVPLFCS